MSEHPASEQSTSEHAEPGHQDPPGGLDADEPQTPYWLTALGGALFLSAAVFFLATAEGDADPEAALPSPPAAEPPSEE
jgi:hypothetical protein